jgi:hypothetical protein
MPASDTGGEASAGNSETFDAPLREQSIRPAGIALNPKVTKRNSPGRDPSTALGFHRVHGLMKCGAQYAPILAFEYPSWRSIHSQHFA